MRKRDPQKEKSIIRTSIELVNKLGFSGISISKIAEKANVSPATIYIYFDNKEDLFTKIYIGIREKLGKAALTNLEETMLIEKQFKLIWSNYYKYSIENIEYILYREHFEQTTMMNNISPEEFKLFEYISNLLEKGIKKRLVKDLPLALLISFSFMPIITLLKLHSEGKLNMDEELIIKASEIAWQTLKR